MAASITHRITGVGLALGMILVAWMLIAVATGPNAYETFVSLGGSIIGRLILFGFAWAVVFHFLNGIRHLWQDLGLGYAPATFVRAGWIVTIGSFVLTALVWAFVLMRGGVA